MLFPVLSLAQTSSVRIDHEPVGFGYVEEALNIQARLDFVEPGSTVETAKIWYKGKQESTFSESEMTVNFEEYSGDIPAEAASPTGLYYYIEFTIISKGQRSKVTFPALDPATKPLEVAFKQRPSGSNVTTAGLLVLTPIPGKSVPAGDMEVWIAIDKKRFRLDPAKLILRIDGKPVAEKLILDDDIVYTTVKGLSEGPHKFAITVPDPALNEKVLMTWSATSGDKPVKTSANTGKKEAPVKAKPSKIWGNVGASYSMQELNGVSNPVTREWASIGGRSGALRFNVKGNFSSEESAKLQPQNRYSVELGAGPLNLRFLDIYPRYNELILWGKRARGAELDLRGWAGSISFVYGEILRKVDSEVTGYDTTWNMSDPNNPIVSRIDTMQTAGTYKRWLGATRISMGDPNAFNIGFTTMKAKDDPESIVYGVKPKDNLVSGFDLQWFMDDRRIDLKADLAWSLYNDDISNAPIEGAESIKNIIWINQNFIPSPSDTSQDKMKIISSAIGKTLSYKTRLRMRYLGNDLQVGYFNIQKSMHSLGLPTLDTDRKGISVSDNLQFFDNRLQLSGEYQLTSDNLSGDNAFTNSINNLTVGISIYAGGYYPDFTANWGMSENSNDADTLSLVSGDPNNPTVQLIDNRQQNKYNSLSFNLAKSIDFKGANHRLSIGQSSSNVDDTYQTLNESQQSFLNFGYVNQLKDFPLTTSLNYAISNNEAYVGMTNLDFNTLTIKSESAFLNSNLKPFVGFRTTGQSGPNRVSPVSPEETFRRLGYDMSDPSIAAQVDTLNLTTVKDVLLDVRQTEWSGGLTYDFLKSHQFRLDFRYTSFSVQNKNRYWNDAEFDASEQSITNTSSTSSVTFDQRSAGTRKNDVLGLVSYSYRF